MQLRFIAMLLASSLLLSCHGSSGDLPPISDKDIENAENIEKLMQEEIDKGLLVEAMDFEGDPKEKGGLFSGLINQIIAAILPKHLEDFDPKNNSLDEIEERFAEYKGVYGRCYQFRVFYPYIDSRVSGVKWASSILSIPRGDRNPTQGGVVLAPTLDGFNPIIESGLWLKLCKKGVATLMPESLYKKKGESWQKLHFDPTPKYKTVDEYTLYEESIQRYEKFLNLNLNVLRNLGKIQTNRGKDFDSLNIMNVNPGRVGFWGSSFGAVVGSMVVAKDPSIKAAVLTVGGGDVPFIISRSKVGLFKSTRKVHMEKLGFDTLDQYKDFIAQYIESDPLNHAKASDADRLFMILAKRDKSVPTSSQYLLWEQFGQPERGVLRGNHIFSLLLTSWFSLNTNRKAIDSVVNKLSQEPLR